MARVPEMFSEQCHTFPIMHADRTLQEVYECTQEKLGKLQDQGNVVKEMWECEWDNEVKYNQELQQFLLNFEIIDPLQPRHAFFGGRTNAVKLHHTVEPDEKIHYVDVTSL